MDTFKEVSIIKKANVYFDGKVTSRTVFFADGTRKTLGIMLPGDYDFSTAAAELIEILDGKLDVLLPGQDTWQTFTAGGQFSVPAHSAFRLKVRSVVDYCCSYNEK
ncbi:MAG TPA: pyrimidine/purine nucleoside phosphorylase [Patescibacteria group bacterium]|nr:pyrimidine/purine nucleoside phosphorylase [Patescibacteria group bacterium]